MYQRGLHIPNEEDELAEVMASIHHSDDRLHAPRTGQIQDHTRRFGSAVKKKLSNLRQDEEPFEVPPYIADRHAVDDFGRSLGRSNPLAGRMPRQQRHNPMDGFGDLADEPAPRAHRRAGHAIPMAQDFGMSAQPAQPPRRAPPARQRQHLAAAAHSRPKKAGGIFSSPQRLQPARRAAEPHFSSEPRRSAEPRLQLPALPSAAPRLLRYVALTVCLLLVGGVGISYGKKAAPGVVATVKNIGAPPSPISDSSKEKIKVPLYYPTDMPAGYDLSTDSISQPADDVLVFTIEHDNGRKIYVSQQKQPSNFDFDQFQKSFNQKQEFEVPLGKLVIGDAGNGQVIGSLTTGQTWVMMNTHQGISYPDLVEIFKHLRKG